MLQVGKTAIVRVKTADSNGRVAREGWAVAEFWAPGKDPEHDPSVRDRPDKSFECFWDEPSRAWTAHVETEGWEPGSWTVRGRAACQTAQGPAKGWSWAAMPLAA